MSALSDFVNEYRTKSGTSSTRTFNVAHLGSNVANAFKGYLRTDLSDDTEALTDTPSTSGSMPQSRNRRLGGWFSFGNDESQCCGLSRLQRIAFFFMCIIGAAFCFGTAVLLLPMLIVNTRKFASLNTLGSVFFLISFGFLWGPIPYIQFLFTPQRRYVTAAYLSSVLATLYTSLWLQNTLLTVVCATFQGLALVWYVLTYIPGGERGLRFITSICTGTMKRQASSSSMLPI